MLHNVSYCSGNNTTVENSEKMQSKPECNERNRRVQNNYAERRKTAQTLCVPLLGDCVSLVLSVNEPTLCRKTLNKHSGISGLKRNIMTGLHYLKLQVSPMQK